VRGREGIDKRRDVDWKCSYKPRRGGWEGQADKDLSGGVYGGGPMSLVGSCVERHGGTKVARVGAAGGGASLPRVRWTAVFGGAGRAKNNAAWNMARRSGRVGVGVWSARAVWGDCIAQGMLERTFLEGFG